MNWTQEQIDKVLAFFDRRRRNYQMVFSRANPADMQVLADFGDYCFANRSTRNERDAGKRDAYLYLTRALYLTPEEQFNLNTQKDKP